MSDKCAVCAAERDVSNARSFVYNITPNRTVEDMLPSLDEQIELLRQRHAAELADARKAALLLRRAQAAEALLRRWVKDADLGKIDGVDLALMVESEEALGDNAESSTNDVQKPS